MIPCRYWLDSQRPRRRAALALTLLSLGCGSHEFSQRRAPTQTVVRFIPTQFDQQISLGIKPKEIHRFNLPIVAGQAVRGLLIQEGVDLRIDVDVPTTYQSYVFDSPINQYGPEPFCIVADQTGVYAIEIRPWSPQNSGSYQLTLEAPRKATDADLACARATQQLGALEVWRSEDSPTETEVLNRYRQVIEALKGTKLHHPLAACLAQTGRREATRGAFENAHADLVQALELFRSLDDSRQQVSVSNWLGRVLGHLGEVSSAIRTLEEAGTIARRIGDQRGLASSLNNLGLLAQWRGKHLEATQHFESALAVAQTIKDEEEQVIFLLNRGISEARMADFGSALNTLKEARQLTLLLPRTRSMVERRIEIEIELAWVLHLTGDSKNALSLLGDAMEQSQATEISMAEAIARDRLGTVLQDLGNHGASLLNYRASQRLVDSHGNLRDRASTQANLGWLFAHWKRPVEAQIELQASLEAFKRLGDRPGQAHSLVGLALTSRLTGQLDIALRYLEEAIELVDTLQVEGGRWGDRYRSIPVWQQYRELQIDLLVELHKKRPNAGFGARAFLISDRSRARGLYELLQEAQLELDPTTPPDLRQQEEDVKTKLLALEDRLLSLRIQQASPEVIDGMALRVSEQERELERIARQIRQTNSAFESLRRPQGTTMREVQALLDSETTLLSFELGEQRSFLFVLNQSQLDVYTLPPRSVIEGAALTLWRTLSTQRSPGTRSQIAGVAQKLSDMLLAPASRALRGRQLIIVGDGVLHYLPFTALPQPGSPERLMVERFELAHVPSAEILGLLRDRQGTRSTDSSRIAIFADPTFSTPTRQAKSDTPSVSLAPLPYSRAEAEAIRRKVPPDKVFVALGSDASLERLAGLDGQNFGILHLATHGFVNEADPRQSGILLSMSDAANQPIDGFLSLNEIYDLKLPTDLVVLSACRTALGEHVRGVGLIGLTRGFYYAGASRLVVSLWNVDDKATAVLMDHFYEALLVEGLRPSAALRKAQLEVRQRADWKAPYYWAGFVLQGDFAPLP